MKYIISLNLIISLILKKNINKELMNVKEYKNNEIIFEGEYLKNKRWNGKGKEYDYKNKLIFEGNYLNGEKMD